MENKEAMKANSFVKIFEDNWDKFKKKFPGYSTDHYDTAVSKMISCGYPSFGYIEFGCLHCGGHRHRVGVMIY